MVSHKEICCEVNVCNWNLVSDQMSHWLTGICACQRHVESHLFLLVTWNILVFRTEQAACLSDQPRTVSQLTFPSKQPGELYNGDIQCKWQFGPHAKLCVYDFAKVIKLCFIAVTFCVFASVAVRSSYGWGMDKSTIQQEKHFFDGQLSIWPSICHWRSKCCIIDQS